MSSILEGMKEIRDPIMSNFDHSIDRKVEAKLKSGPAKIYSAHTAWNFCGYVWFEKGKFHEEVWRHKSPVDVISADNLELLMEKVNSKYGSE